MLLRTLSIYLIILIIQLLALSSIFIALVGTNDDIDVGPDVENSHNDNTVETQMENQKAGELVPEKDFQVVDKIGIVIIDAMRFDFIPQMEFIQRGLEKDNFACLFQVSLDGPTVTLPRIKALVSGATSNYWEILTNLKQSSQMNVDNFIWRANAKGKRIVFYGDDTWLKLFPNPNEFRRKEGVTSFFVTDFYEVDNNVTRNVNLELATMDFDMMILHYLGVDHVGHVHGPKHPLIPIKLKEMDLIIQNIYEKMLHSAQQSNQTHLIIVTGDHGMANLGGHGGDSHPEVTTPLVVLTVSNGKKTASICQSRNEKQLAKSWMDSPFNLKQVDIATIISSLWNLPLPSKSRGVIAPEIFSQLPQTQFLSILHKNVQHLTKFLHSSKPTEALLLQKFMDLSKLSSQSISSYQQQQQQHGSNTGDETNVTSLITEYLSFLQELKKVAGQDVNQNLPLLYSSSILLFQTIFLLMVSFSNLTTLLTYTIVLLLLVSLSFISSGDFLQSSIYLIVFVNFLYLLLILINNWRPRISKKLKNLNFITMKEKLTSSLIIHAMNFMSPVLYFSSSFVEEEHLATYFLYTTALVMSSFNLFMNSSATFKNLVVQMIKLSSLIGIHRLCSCFNATGQKWNYLPDLNQYLKESGLSDLFIFLAFLLILYRLSSNFERLAGLGILCYKLNVYYIVVSNLMKIMMIKSVKNDENYECGHVEAKVCYLLILISMLVPEKKKKNILNNSKLKRTSNSWLLLCSLLQRKENIILVFLVDVQVEIIQSLWSTSHEDTMQIRKKKNENEILPQRQVGTFNVQSSLLNLLMFSSFFYQGNSNNITTIDISLGYTGLSTYNEYIVGTLTFVATFCLPILVIARSTFTPPAPIWNVDQTKKGKGVGNRQVFSNVSSFNHSIIHNLIYKITITNCVYSIVLISMRQHLFIWSVFVPKLLYLIALTCLTICINIMCIFFNFVPVISQTNLNLKTANFR